MKKTLILVTCLSYSSFAQNLPLTERHTIQSKIVEESGSNQAVETPTIEEGKDIGKVKVEIVRNNGKSMMGTWRVFTLRPENQGWFVDMRMKRLIKRVGQTLDVDTDNSFPSDERNKQATDHYLQYIDQPIQLSLTSKWDTLSLKNPKLTVYDLSNTSVPQLHRVVLFSGIFLDPSRFKEKSWKEELVRDKTVYTNTFTMNEESADRIKLLISGTQTEFLSLNGVKNETIVPVAGQNVTATSGGNDLRYDGFCWVSETTGFISEIELYVKGTSVMHVMGQTMNRKVNKKYTITNTLASK